jgi:hypothetical protein
MWANFCNVIGEDIKSWLLGVGELSLSAISNPYS